MKSMSTTMSTSEDKPGSIAQQDTSEDISLLYIVKQPQVVVNHMQPAEVHVIDKTLQDILCRELYQHCFNPELGRLQQELRTLLMSGDPGVSAFPDGDNLFRWLGTLTGPKGTVYENLSYKLSLEFPSGYPYKPPTVKFLTPCYHPNVDQSGNICLDILREKWSALYDVRTILLSLQSLLGEPNNESPLNAQAAELWSNQMEYKRILLEKYKQNEGKK